jgi:glutamate-1-semialdehyde 2,1-aminomutase
VHEHVFRLGELTRRGLTELFDRLDVPAVVSGYGSVFVTYFMQDPPRSFDDLLGNDAELFCGYRREQLQDGVLELPLNLKRSHFSYAHTEADVERLLAATERATRNVLRRRGQA